MRHRPAELQTAILYYTQYINITLKGQAPYGIQGYAFIGTITVPILGVHNTAVRLLCVVTKELPGRLGLCIVTTYPWTRVLSKKLRAHDTHLHVVYTHIPSTDVYLSDKLYITLPNCKIVNHTI